MNVKIECPNPDCRRSFIVSEEHLGRKGRCKECGRVFRLGAPELSSPQGSSLASPEVALGSTSDHFVDGTIPARIGRFQIRGPLGSGGFATVYRAYDPQLE